MKDAGVAQLVERNLAKVEVEGSRPFSRSIVSCHPVFQASYGRIAKWLCSGLQSRRHRFDSVSCLHYPTDCRQLVAIFLFKINNFPLYRAI